MNEIRLINANDLEIELTKQKAHLMDKACHTTIESDRMMYVNTATGLLHAINILHNVPTVAVNCKECDGYETGYSAGLKDTERPIGDCENCDYRKFTEKFIDGFVEGLNKYGIASVEQLSEILGKGNDNE